MESGGGKTTFEAEYKGRREDLGRDILRASVELGWKVTRVRAEGARSTWKRAAVGPLVRSSYHVEELADLKKNKNSFGEKTFTPWHRSAGKCF